MQDLIESITQCSVHGKNIPIIAHKLQKNFHHSVKPQEVCSTLQKFTAEELACVKSIVLAQPGDDEIKLRAHGEFCSDDNQILVYALKMTKKKTGKEVFKLQCQGKTAKGKIREVTPEEAHDRVLNDVIPHEVCHAMSKCIKKDNFNPGEDEEAYARSCSIDMRKRFKVTEKPTYLGGFCAIVRG